MCSQITLICSFVWIQEKFKDAFVLMSQRLVFTRRGSLGCQVAYEGEDNVARQLIDVGSDGRRGDTTKASKIQRCSSTNSECCDWGSRRGFNVESNFLINGPKNSVVLDGLPNNLIANKQWKINFYQSEFWHSNWSWWQLVEKSRGNLMKIFWVQRYCIPCC